MQRLLHWLLQPARIPLLFSVTIVSGMFYHYAPKFILPIILISIVIQAGLFRLFGYVRKHPLLGGAAYIAAGALFLFCATVMIRLGYDDAVFGPENANEQLAFWVWYLTPQSVLVTAYPGYTIALFILYTYFIATIAYYYTMVYYRVLMSFVVMLFPFAIYAKENETMPVLSILILLFCYFAVMVYCRQAHTEDSSVVQIYHPDTVSGLSAPAKRSRFAKVKPEVLDGRFLQSTGIFLAAASILILILPKPEVKADRTVMDNMLDLTALSSYLEDALNGFMDTSDGGNYSSKNLNRTLYHVRGSEPLNLRVRTFTDYHYASDSWSASDYDRIPNIDDSRYRMVMSYFFTASDEQSPAELVQLVQYAAQTNPEFAGKWHLEPLLQADAGEEDYYLGLDVLFASFSTGYYPAPLHTAGLVSVSNWGMRFKQNQSDIIFRYTQDTDRIYREQYSLKYLSDRYANTDAAQALMSAVESWEWSSFLLDLRDVIPDDGSDYSKATDRAVKNYLSAVEYAQSVASETPEAVRELAMQITDGLTTDYEKAMAICDYLKNGEYRYSLGFRKSASDNVETFLFRNKEGVCYQFASAMAELCRAVGLPVRYVEGYMMSEREDEEYVVKTTHAHAFTDVYISGYGWMMIDATAPSNTEDDQNRGGVILALQYSGIILFGIAMLVIVTVAWIIPAVREKQFRRRFRKAMDASSVQDAFARLRKQWKADPSKTARVLCEEQAAFLNLNLGDLLEGIEQTVYANRCTKETAERVYRIYCAAYDAYKPALKRKKKQNRETNRQKKSAAAG
ncbi:MAG: transglutaminase domain-containing protein [Oscillospiraceae bacterium]|nr:transglutaminase domain-containing protein [Oscillospiraceae bacterium]